MDDLTNKTPSETEVYDAVILGDAVDGFCYKNLNKAFQTIMKTGCHFYSLGLGRFYREGKYVRAVEVPLGYLQLSILSFCRWRIDAGCRTFCQSN